MEGLFNGAVTDLRSSEGAHGSLFNSNMECYRTAFEGTAAELQTCGKARNDEETDRDTVCANKDAEMQCFKDEVKSLADEARDRAGQVEALYQTVTGVCNSLNDVELNTCP